MKGFIEVTAVHIKPNVEIIEGVLLHGAEEVIENELVAVSAISRISNQSIILNSEQQWGTNCITVEDSYDIIK